MDQLEKTIEERTKKLKENDDKENEINQLLKYGIEGYKKKILENYKTENSQNPENQTTIKIRNDPSIRFPHRKIIEYLQQQYDHDKQEFKESNFSTIVKKCRIGKNKAGEYLKLLQEKGYITKREDGYRKWYKICT